MVEGPSVKDPNELQGRTENNRVVNFIGSKDLVGTIVTTRITESLQLHLAWRVGLTELNHLDEESTLRNTPVPVLHFIPQPLDNLRLAHLCGPLDENLRQISAALDLSIFRRGDKFIVSGHNAEKGLSCLRSFTLKRKDHQYRRSAAGLGRATCC